MVPGVAILHGVSCFRVSYKICINNGTLNNKVRKTTKININIVARLLGN